MKTGIIYKSIIGGLTLLSLSAMSACGGGKKADPFDSVTAEGITPKNAETYTAAPDTDMAVIHNGRIHINNIGPLREVFNDSNKYHYAVAERIGIAPIASLSEAYYTSKPVVRVKS